MQLIRKLRFSMATVMMLVVAAAACSALFAKAREHIPVANQPYVRFDAPFLFVLSIVLTAVALGALKGHTAVQMMLQTTIACLGYVSLIGLFEAGMHRPLLYWFQVSFGLLVTIPLLARRSIKRGMPRGPRRDWWRGTCEAVLFAFFTMMLVLWGLLIEAIAFQVMATPTIPPPNPPATPAAPVAAPPAGFVPPLSPDLPSNPFMDESLGPAPAVPEGKPTAPAALPGLPPPRVPGTPATRVGGP